MRILFTGKNHSQGLKDLDPSSLAGTAQSLGYGLVYSLDDAPEVVICVDFDRSVLPLIREAKSRGVKTVLIANEPEVVIPEHSQDRVLKEFSQVVKVGRPETRESLYWPQTWRPISENNERLDRVVLVNADKWSFVRGQHYWIRAAASSQLEIIDVFGFGWNRPLFVRLAHRTFELWRAIRSRASLNFQGISKTLAKPRSYKGAVSDKVLAMSSYRVALVIENSSEFLSEKLFDAWFAGCIPVYLGPKVESFGIPKGLLVQVENPSLDEIQKSIDVAFSIDHEMFLRDVRSFLSSNCRQNWKSDVALQRILSSSL